MMRTWLFLALAGGLIQALLAAKLQKQAAGLLLPAVFALFAGYACVELLRVGIDFPVLFCLWLPPVVQLLLFELAFWWKKYTQAEKETGGHET